MLKYLSLLLVFSITAVASTRFIDGDVIRSSDRSSTWTPPGATDNLLGATAAQTITNKVIDGAFNTILNVAGIPTLSGNNSVVFTNGQGKLVAGNLIGDGALNGSTLTIQPAAITNAKMANMVNSTIKCNISGSSGPPSDCTINQLQSAFTIVGALLGVNNLSDLTNAGTARNNLGLGDMALQSKQAYLLGSNNLSDTANSTVARANLGFPVIGTGSVLFGNNSTLPATDPGFVWDNTNKRLGINTIAPAQSLEVKATGGGNSQINLSQPNGNGPASFSVGVNGYLTIQDTGKNILNTDASGDVGLLGCPANGQANLDSVCIYSSAGNTTKSSFTVYGIGSQTGDLFQTRNSANQLLANISNIGVASVQKISVGSTVGVGATLVDVNGTGVYTGSTVAVPACFAIPASNIDWSRGNCFTMTMGANSTFTFSNAVAGQNIMVRVTNPASYTLGWPATAIRGGSVLWTSSTIPTQSTTNKTDLWGVFFDGANFYGTALQGY